MWKSKNKIKKYKNKVLKNVGKEKLAGILVYKSFYFIRDACALKFNLEIRKLF